jgi:integrase
MSDNSPIVQVDFKKPPRQSYKKVAEGVYQEPLSGKFYWRPYFDGKQHWRKLHSTTLTSAKKERAKLASDLAMSKSGMAENPLRVGKRVGDLIEFYREAGCPKRDEKPRAGVQLVAEKARLDLLKEWWGERRVNTITQEDCRDYHADRRKQIGGGRGDRSVDLELATLSAVFRWAARNARKTGVTANPLAEGRVKFRHAGDVLHCRSRQPVDAEELHALARCLFGHHGSEVLGWQMLFEAFTGQRTHEVLRLRMDAVPGDPGSVTEDSSGAFRYRVPGAKGVLHLYRSRTHKGTYGYAEIHPALGELLAAHRLWHRQRYPDSPWFFPSRDRQQAAGVSSLTQALRRAARVIGAPPRTSHGLRAYAVSAFRTLGISDADIALLIGHKTGGRLIVDTYGEIRPERVNWMPAGEPCWAEMMRRKHTTSHTSSDVTSRVAARFQRIIRSQKIQ